MVEGSAQKEYLFRLQVCERVGISLVEGYKRVGKSVGYQKDFMAVNVLGKFPGL